MDNELPELVSVPKAAEMAGVARNTMRLAAKNGKIKAIRPGRNWLIFASDIERWKQENYRPDMALKHPKTEEKGDSEPS